MTSAPRLPRCGDTARRRQDPQLGTAPVIRRWLLIEHPGPWPIEALDVPEFSPELRAAATTAVRSIGGRVLLVRRPGRAGQLREGASRAWGVVTDTGSVWGRWTTDQDLFAAVETLREPPSAQRRDPLLLVCAHGVHDTCCALRGRPVAAELAGRWPEATWECTHVGGDRFAPNVVVLPDGVYYGYLDTDDAVDVIERHFAGELSVAHLRGLTRYPPPAQAAVGEVQRRWGPYQIDDVVVAGVSSSRLHRWDVDLVLPDRGDIRATVVASNRPAARLTCRAAAETSALEYVVSAIEEHPSRSRRT